MVTLRMAKAAVISRKEENEARYARCQLHNVAPRYSHITRVKATIVNNVVMAAARK